MERSKAWDAYPGEKKKEVFDFAEGYRKFLSENKTERECIKTFEARAKKAGFVNLSDAVKTGRTLVPGDRLYYNQMGKSMALFVIGEEPLCDGMNIVGAHIDSPRLDLKQNPLYEDTDLVMLDTHYYGGVKKYQWVTLPLALHGVVIKKDGTTVEIKVGEDGDDPVFFISDLLIHLASEQLEKKANKVIEGEALDIIVGNRPLCLEKKDTSLSEGTACEGKKEKDPVKQGILRYLKDTYDMEEEDFLSAELEVVPAGRAREAGFDRSMILAYGQDDRVCAFASLKAMLELEAPERTACCILVDKEEIGSVGATGMRSRFFENSVAELMALCGGYDELSLRRCLAGSTMLSSDVSSAFDPAYASSFDKKNVAYLGRGMVFNKFTGSRGKSGSNDANAEYMAYIRDIFEKEQVVFQTAELGRVDLGGGGTIAYILALYGMNVIDSGVAVLNMHAPWEATSKADVYETKRGYAAFLKYNGMDGR